MKAQVSTKETISLQWWFCSIQKHVHVISSTSELISDVFLSVSVRKDVPSERVALHRYNYSMMPEFSA